jgi:hypothetical protein
MPRRIRTVSLQGTAGSDVDTYFDRVIKYIPADVVGAWVAVTGVINSQANVSPTIWWLAFAVGTLAAAAWTWKQTSEPGKPTATVQILVATVAFVVWVFALGGPFAGEDWYKPYQGSLVLIAFTLLVGLIIPKE